MPQSSQPPVSSTTPASTIQTAKLHWQLDDNGVTVPRSSEFGDVYFSDEVKNFINENYKIKASLEHRPNDEKSPKYQDFLEKLQEKIKIQQSKVKHKIFS